MITRALLAAALAGLALFAPLRASAQSADDHWTFSVMPYLWLPSVDGKLNYGPTLSASGASPSVTIDASTVVDNLAIGLMIAGEARKGRWLVATDLVYFNLQNAASAVRSVDFNLGPGPINISTAALNAGTEAKLEGVVWTMMGGYAAVQEPRLSLDLIGGFRYLGVRATTDWQLTGTVTGTGPLGQTATFPRTGSVEQSDNVWAGIVGAKGRVNLGESNWFVNYYADVGGASSLFTWQGAAGIGYAFRWGEIIFDYRYLHYNQSADKMIDSISLGGFALGANFRF